MAKDFYRVTKVRLATAKLDTLVRLEQRGLTSAEWHRLRRTVDSIDAALAALAEAKSLRIPPPPLGRLATRPRRER